jgi:hypothetical protein
VWQSSKSFRKLFLHLLIYCSEHRKHEHERGTGVGGTTGNTGLGQSTGGNQNTTGTTGHQSSHVGRDAAVVGGGAGLAEQ